MVRLLMIIILLPFLSFSQNNESQYLFSIVGGGDLLANKYYQEGHERMESVNRQPGVSCIAMFALCKGHNYFPAVAVRYVNRAGSYVSSYGSLGGGFYSYGNYHLDRGDIIALYYFPISKRGFITFGTGLYYGYLLNASGKAYSESWSISRASEMKEIPMRKAISDNTIGAMLDFRFNIPVHQKHLLTFSLNFSLETSPAIAAFGKTVGVSLGYTFRKLLKRDSEKKIDG